MLSRLGATLIASIVVTALVAPGAGAHDGVMTAAGHAAEDAVTHTVAQEPALDAHTRAVTASDAMAAAAAVGGAPQDVGQWGPIVDWPVVGVHVALLPNGKVLAYDSIGDNATETYPVQDHTRATVWDPATGTQTPVNVGTGFNIFCSGLAHLVDGRMFIAGGNKDQQLNGIVQTHLFDPVTNLWSLGPNMAAGRWYPTVTPLSNGEVLITSGRVDTPEVRTMAGGLRALSTASLSLPLYPWMDVAPNGQAFYSGPDQTLRTLDTAGTGTWQALGQRDTINRDYGGHALFDVGKMLVAGGGPSTTDARVVDLNGATPQVSPTAPMAYGRRQHNLTVLADGTVLATGGNSSGALLVDLNAGVYPAEQWNPATGQWRTLAAMQITRQYHSTALLLPDGRVLSSGGGICGTCDQVGYLAKNAEVFSPPYLFQADGTLAPRPAIDAAPTSTSNGAAMEIATGNPASIRKVALVRLGAVTHSDNMEQRYIPLSFTAGATSIIATAPANANVAPPGFYMLFIIDANGVPSVAHMVRVKSNSSPSVALTQPTDGATFTPPATVNLAATASDADGSVTKVEFFNGAAKLGEDTTLPYSFTWSGVAAGTYTLTARATDDLGATTTSVASRITVSGNTPPTTTLTLAADADAPVKESAPGANFASANLRTDGGSGIRVESYLRFTVPTGVGTIDSVKLRVYASSATADGPAAYSAGSGWTESGLTWTNRPARTGSGTDDKARIVTNSWVEYNVKSLVTGPGTYTFVLAGASSDGVDFFSREAASGNKPQLVVSTGGGSPPTDSSPPTVPQNLAATTAGSTQINLGWTASTDDVAVTGYDVYRGPAGGTLALVASTAATGTTYTDGGLAPSTAYAYQVRARDASGKVSGASNTATATTSGASPPPAISLVKQTTGSVSGATSLALPVTSVAGHALVANIAVKAGGSVTVASVVDSSGATWTKAAVGFLSGSNTRVETWYRLGAPAVGSVTATLSAANTAAANVTEWSGVATTGTLDGAQGSGSAASTTAAAPSITTTQPGDLVISAMNYPGNVASALANGGFTALTSFSGLRW